MSKNDVTDSQLLSILLTYVRDRHGKTQSPELLRHVSDLANLPVSEAYISESVG